MPLHQLMAVNSATNSPPPPCPRTLRVSGVTFQWRAKKIENWGLRWGKTGGPAPPWRAPLRFAGARWGAALEMAALEGRGIPNCVRDWDWSAALRWARCTHALHFAAAWGWSPVLLGCARVVLAGSGRAGGQTDAHGNDADGGSLGDWGSTPVWTRCWNWGPLSAASGRGRHTRLAGGGWDACCWCAYTAD